MLCKAAGLWLAVVGVRSEQVFGERALAKNSHVPVGQCGSGRLTGSTAADVAAGRLTPASAHRHAGHDGADSCRQQARPR